MNALWDALINRIPDGPAMTSGALLIRADGTNGVYLLTNGLKHLIASPAVMTYCSFDWTKVKQLPLVVRDAIPDGPVINYVGKQP